MTVHDMTTLGKREIVIENSGPNAQVVSICIDGVWGDLGLECDELLRFATLYYVYLWFCVKEWGLGI